MDDSIDDESDVIEHFQTVIDGIFTSSLTATKTSNALTAHNDHGILSTFPEWRSEVYLKSYFVFSYRNFKFIDKTFNLIQLLSRSALHLKKFWKFSKRSKFTWATILRV